MTQTRSFELPTGVLTVEIDRNDRADAEGDIFGVAARRNPKRAFVFVSNVLGRHVPVSPSTMREIHCDLAFKLPADLPGPVVFVGMAETAIALGAGVYREYVRTTRREDCVFLPSTRHPVSDRILASFTEDHSHATRHLLHVPDDLRAEKLLRSARTLVMVDDETTTGNTFANLERAVRSACRSISSVQRVVIKDWSASLPGSVHSVLSGRYHWEADPDAPVPPDPNVDVTARGAAPIVAPEWGRQGLTGIPRIEMVPCEAKHWLVLGTGEYVWPAYVHALGMERHLFGLGKGSVRFAATTRSPIFVGGAVSSASTFADNYGLGIPNHLYNVEPDDYDEILVFSETAPEHFDPSFVERFSPRFVVPGETAAAAA